MNHSALLLFALTASAAPVLAASDVGLPAINAGDYWTYQERDGYNNNLKGSFRVEVTSVDEGGVHAEVTRPTASPASETSTREWNPVSRIAPTGGRIDYAPEFPMLRFPLEPGKTWRETTVAINSVTGGKMDVKVWGKVLGRERVKVPAGEFDAIKIRRQVYPQDQEWWRSGTKILEYDWYSPDVNRIVKHTDYSEFVDRTRSPRQAVVRGDENVVELVSYGTRAASKRD